MACSSPAALIEVRSLFHLVETGTSTVAGLRELIAVSPADDRVLRAAGLIPARRFRMAVLQEFNKLVHQRAVARSLAAQERNDLRDMDEPQQHQQRIMQEAREAVKVAGGVEILSGVGTAVPAVAISTESQMSATNAAAQ